MAKQSSSSENFDFNAFGSDMIKKTTEAFKKNAEMFKDVKMPGVDHETLQASQRRNVELLTTAQQTALETMKALAKLQTDFIKGIMDTMTHNAQHVVTAPLGADKVDAQTESVKKEIERAAHHTQEMTRVLSKGQGEVISLVQRRACEAVDEARDIISKVAQK